MTDPLNGRPFGKEEKRQMHQAESVVQTFDNRRSAHQQLRPHVGLDATRKLEPPLDVVSIHVDAVGLCLRLPHGVERGRQGSVVVISGMEE